MRTWACKFKFSLQRLQNNIFSIVTGTMGILGALLTICEGASEIFYYNGLFVLYKEYFLYIIIISGLIMVIVKWDHLSITEKVVGAPDVSITIKVCDALANDGAVIIPTNTTFDTVMDDDFISEASLQGQFQLKYYRDKFDELDGLIINGLAEKKYTVLSDGRKTNTKRYPLGTISRIPCKKKRAYFLAVADIYKNGIPITPDASDMHTSLNRLWDELNYEGNMETYSVPLIGTGKAGVRDITREEIIKEIILTFLLSTQNYKLTEHLIICVHPSDYTKIDWDEMGDYLKYNCKYFYAQRSNFSSSVPEGTAEKSNGDISSFNKEQQTLQLLENNNMTRKEIASALGMSMASTTRLLSQLAEKKAIGVYGDNKNRIYTKAGEKLKC